MSFNGPSTTKSLLLRILLLTITQTIWLPRLSSHESITTTVSYDREVVRILKKKCIMCHSENNLGMPLTSYEQTRPWARAIEDEVLIRHMPPWRAVDGYNQFANDVSLTNRELQFLVSWVEGNGPKTKGQQSIESFGAVTAERERLKLDVEHWQLGRPDITLGVPNRSIQQGSDHDVRRLRIALGFSSDRLIRALEFQPANRRVLRAAFFSLEETGQWIGSWTPWYGVTRLPRGVAYRVPAGSHVIAELHFNGMTDPVEEWGILGFYFVEAPLALHRASGLVLEAAADGAGGDDGRQRLVGSVTLLADSKIIAFKPELVLGIKSVEVTARKPDGAVEVLLLIKDALPDWPTPYIIKEPIVLPKNTELDVTAYYQGSLGEKSTSSFRLLVNLSDAVESRDQPATPPLEIR